MPAEDARDILATVQAAVRALPIPSAEGWAAEFVGGGRSRGVAGHDVDILLSHPTEMASFIPRDEKGEGARERGDGDGNGRL